VCPASAYREFLAPVRDAGIAVTPADVAGSVLAQASGRSTPEAEAMRVAQLAAELGRDSTPIVLGGHSRGGLVAYLAAAAVQPAALVLVDPVSGGGPPWAKPAPLPPVGWSGPTLVLGCGLGGHCAPTGRNHEVFAAALPGCAHTVVADSGHADLLDGHLRTFGRLLCARGSDPDRARATLAAQVVAFLNDLTS
jgi:predicted alpha/beta-hydrolase family hydrolase